MPTGPAINNFNDTAPAPSPGFQDVKWQLGPSTGNDPAYDVPIYPVSVQVPNTGGTVVHTGSYTAVAGDCGVRLVFNSATAVTLTLPTSTTVHMAAVAVTFGTSPVNYAARTITITAPTVATWLYLTIADPTQAGESGSPTLTATLSATTALVGVQGNTYMGAILALPAGSAVSELAGGWPAPQTVQVGA